MGREQRHTDLSPVISSRRARTGEGAIVTAMEFPDIRFTEVDGLRIAYQVWGSGPPLLIVPQIVSNIELHNEHEFYRRVREHLGRHFTCLEFDKRGLGLSDRLSGYVPPLEERIGDMIAVMDAVGWETAHVLGVSEGGCMAQLFAVQYPERVESLVLHSTYVSPRYWGGTPPA